MRIEISNIKQIKDLKQEFPDGCSLILAKGMNRSGKTTLAQALRAVITQEGISNAVTTGEEEGIVKYKGKTVDGDDIILKWIAGQNKDSFSASIIKGERSIVLKKKGDIRALTGQFFRYSSDDIFNMLYNEPGRKKFIKEFILTFFSEDDYKKYEIINEQLSPKNPNSKYNERTETNRRLKDLEAILSKPIGVQYDEAHYNTIESAIKLNEKISFLREQYLRDIDKVETTKAEILGKTSFLCDRLKYDKGTLVDDIDKLISDHFQKYFNDQKDFALKLKKDLSDIYPDKDVDELKEMQLQMLSSKKLTDQLSSQRDEYKRLERRSTELEGEIAKLRESLSNMLKEAKLPEGLSIEGTDIFLNGLPFGFDNTSDSEARLMITELLCIINTSKFVDIGDVTIFDENSLNKIIEIAKKHDCMLIGQKVTNDDNLKIEIDGEIHE
jgi:hypothetical protein